jgi:CDP-diglyceride synthetase
MPAGQGGFLDMFDSVLFIPAMAYPILVMFNTSL